MTQRTGSNPVTIPTTDPLHALRYQRMGRELRMTDQMLSFDLDSVAIGWGLGKGAPAWTSADGAGITIDAERMPRLVGKVDNMRRNVAVWLGTNAHEVFHNLYTPRADSPLMLRIAASNKVFPGVRRSWNVLEDQRIERLGLARYEAWRGYLVTALAHHIDVTHPNAWTLVAGRTWLSDEVRAIARAAFVATNDDDAARTCAALIAAYQSLTDPGHADAEEAFTIVMQFHSLFGAALPPKGGCGTETIESGEPETPDPDDAQYPVADDDPQIPDTDDESDDESGEGDDGDAPADDDDEPGEGDESDEGDDDGESDEGDESGDDGDEPGEGDDDGDDESGDGDGDDESGDGDDESDDDEGGDTDDDDDGDADGDDGGEADEAGDDDESGDGRANEGNGRTIEDAMRDEIDEALGDDIASTELDRVLDQLDNGHAGRGDLDPKTGDYVEATERARLLAREVTAVLVDIKDQCEAAWIRRTDHGRFSVDRWATEVWDADTVFDYFDPGAMDASSLDLVLVNDVSGSMGHVPYTPTGQKKPDSNNVKLAAATWAIRTAVDRIEGHCTGIGFGDDASLMFDGGRRPDGRMFIPHLESSTNPVGALREAYRIVAESSAANRIVILLSDGDFNTDAAKPALRACAAAGATTCFVGLGKDSRGPVHALTDAVHVAAAINDPAELVPIFRAIAERSMLAAASGHGR